MFRRSLDLVAECGLAFVHVFPYSPRPGTPAARMPQLARCRRQGAGRAAAGGRRGRARRRAFRPDRQRNRCADRAPRTGRAAFYAAVSFATPGDGRVGPAHAHCRGERAHLIGVAGSMRFWRRPTPDRFPDRSGSRYRRTDHGPGAETKRRSRRAAGRRRSPEPDATERSSAAEPPSGTAGQRSAGLERRLLAPRVPAARPASRTL